MNFENDQKIGPYKVIRHLGKGGMGEVYLVFDPVCERNVALKCIRSDLKHKKPIQRRFLREAKIASQLTHPSIIPIYSIHEDPENIYYTMSFVEGETLRDVLSKTSQQIKKGETPNPLGISIPALTRIFLNVCEAIAYTHSKGILHRDLKPDNIIIGKYGEVMILDWGIADYIESSSKNEKEIELAPVESPDLTRPGKVAGTVPYMAPERALGKPASVRTDIYSLGAILFQILTLQHPFNRGNLQAFRKTMKDEVVPDPIEVAPYREIPHSLAQIAKKCLSVEVKDRYSSMPLLIHDIKSIIEGKPEWVFMGELSMGKKSDWEFQENVLFAKHTAISRGIDVSEWVSLMVSRESFSDNIKIEAEVCIENEGGGIGFLFSIPEASKRKSLEEGYCFWISAKNNTPSCQLFRSNVLVMESTDAAIPLNKWHTITIEKENDHVKCYLNGELLISYSSHLPLAGTHVGLLHKDVDFSLRKFQIFLGSHNVMVNCLAVPDAFFAHKDFDTALIEYRKIGKCFPGRAEGREALFRAGMTLLEKAKAEKGKKEKQELFDLAHKEFENLHATPGAPLEYMGKSMVYDALKDTEEEAKCLEFALRKFPKHPLLPILEEHIIYRMHESAHQNRDAAYRLVLIAIRYFPRILKNKDTQNLINSLQKHWEDLSFIEPPREGAYSNNIARLAIILAFWTNKKETLMEIIRVLTNHEPYDDVSIENALFCLLELGWYKELKEMLLFLQGKPMYGKGLDIISLALMSHYRPASVSLKNFFKTVGEKMGRKEIRVLCHILQKAILNKETVDFDEIVKKCSKIKIDAKDRASLDALFIWHLLSEKNVKEADALLNQYSIEALGQERHPLFVPYGAYLYLSESPEMAMIHFSGILATPLPPTTSLAAHYLAGLIDEKKGWIKEAFHWEKIQLYRGLALFFLSINDQESYKQFEKKARYET